MFEAGVGCGGRARRAPSINADDARRAWHGVNMTTSRMPGAFRANPDTRCELLALIAR